MAGFGTSIPHPGIAVHAKSPDEPLRGESGHPSFQIDRTTLPARPDRSLPATLPQRSCRRHNAPSASQRGKGPLGRKEAQMASEVIRRADEHRFGTVLIGSALVLVVVVLGIQAASLTGTNTGPVGPAVSTNLHPHQFGPGPSQGRT